jgi:hypothetical protein
MRAVRQRAPSRRPIRAQAITTGGAIRAAATAALIRTGATGPKARRLRRAIAAVVV